MLQVVATIILFVLLREVYFGMLPLAEESYYKPLYLHDLFQKKQCLIALALATLPLFLFFKRISWRKFDELTGARTILFLIVTAVALESAFYQYNFVFGQLHGVERLSILVLGFLVFLSPAWIPLFITLALLATFQFEFGLEGQFGWENRYPIIALLILFHAWLLVRAILKGADARLFLYLALCLQASHYFYSGLDKAFLGHDWLDWVKHDNLGNLFIAHHVGGWLPGFAQEKIIETAGLIGEASPALAGVVFGLELLIPLLLFHPTLSVLFLLFFTIFHYTLALGFGIFFWRWILINLGLIYLVAMMDGPGKSILYKWRHCFIAVPIIIFAGGFLTNYPYFYPVRLSWVDSPVTSVFSFEATGESGETYKLRPRDFSPYHYPVLQNEFSYLSRDPRLVYHAGMVRTKNPKDSVMFAKRLAEIETSEELQKFRRREGQVVFNAERVEGCKTFLQRFALAFNEKLIERQQRDTANPFSAIWQYLTAPKEPLKEIRVRRKEYFYNGESIIEFSNQVVLKVEVVEGQKAGTPSITEQPLKSSPASKPEALPVEPLPPEEILPEDSEESLPLEEGDTFALPPEGEEDGPESESTTGL